MPRAKPHRDWIASAPLTDSVRALAQRGELCRFDAGDVLIQEGAFGDTLYIVLDGRLRVYGSTMVSDRKLRYASYGPGEYVGEMGLDGGPRAASVRAEEPTICVMITRRTLEQHIAEHPAFAFELLSKVIARARAATLSAKRMALNDVYGCFKLWVESTAEPQPDGTWRVAEKLTQQDLGEWLGCTREMVARLFKDLRKGGYLEHTRGELVLYKTLPPRF